MTSQFVPGLKVALVQSHGHQSRYLVRVVDKVHKNGNFTLVGDAQQYRPDYAGRSARQTGRQGYHPESVQVWDEQIDAEVASRAKQRATDLIGANLATALAGRRNGYGNYCFTPEQLAAVEACLAALKS